MRWPAQGAGPRDEDPCARVILATLGHALPADRLPWQNALALAQADPTRFLAWLHAHKVAPLWAAAVDTAGLTARLPDQLADGLMAATESALRLSLAHEVALRRVGRAFDEGGLRWVVFKGAHLAHACYDEPHLRAGVDVDLVVERALAREAGEALRAAGFARVAGSERNTTHEVGYAGHGVSLDLHVEIFRPGQSRRPLGPCLIDSRRKVGALWVPSTAMTLVVLLVHPAVTEHVTGPFGRLIDLDRWIRDHVDVADWREAVALLQEVGLAGAGWASLEWLQSWMATPLPDGVQDTLAPRAARQAWIRAWLRARPMTLQPRWPVSVRLGFGLALQDSWRDRARSVGLAATGWRRYRGSF